MTAHLQSFLQEWAGEASPFAPAVSLCMQNERGSKLDVILFEVIHHGIELRRAEFEGTRGQ